MTIDLHNIAVQQLNAYRQARHAWLACAGDIHEKSQLRAVMEVAAADLAGFVNSAVQLELGEPDEWANA
ncbi:hypothetical protein H8F21_14370 [Pseudomonas sp. P66]|uniref:Uncharacterized protein n=1 Tax=Pseudomonas arcuscaelestis TaxID=2710591 RepID=A0ABS2C126_9PSED|nr:hypothetical protein [Pseudomonas arcuscaelestis]